jgi:hypothetical protein
MTIDLILNSAILMEDVQKRMDTVRNAMKMNTITMSTRSRKMRSDRKDTDPKGQQDAEDRKQKLRKIKIKNEEGLERLKKLNEQTKALRRRHGIPEIGYDADTEKEIQHYDTVTFSFANDTKKQQKEDGAGIKILKAIAKPFVYLYNKFKSLLAYSYRDTEHKFEDSSPNRKPLYNFSINHRNPVKVTSEKVQKIEGNARERILVAAREKTFF